MKTKIINIIALGFAVLITASATAKVLTIPNSSLLIKVENQTVKYHPLALNLYHSNQTHQKIDQYSVEGGDPILKDYKVITIGKKKHLLILIMWEMKHYDVSGNYYQTFVYDLNEKGLEKNKVMSDDYKLSGGSLYYRDEGSTLFYNDKLYLVTNYLKAQYGTNKKQANNLCSPDEKVIFSCELNNNKIISICDNNKNKDYRYGKKNKVELTQKLTNKSNLTFTHNASERKLSFKRGEFTYKISEKNKLDFVLSARKKENAIFSKLCINTSHPLPSDAFFNH